MNMQREMMKKLNGLKPIIDMAKAEKNKFRITFSNNGTVDCDSYETGINGIFWVNGTIHGYSTNDLVKSVKEIIKEQG